MQKELNTIKDEVINRVKVLFMEKFNGNQRKFARAASCDEKTIRLLFQEDKSGMTLNLLFKLASALETTPSKLLEGLEISKNNPDSK